MLSFVCLEIVYSKQLVCIFNKRFVKRNLKSVKKRTELHLFRIITVIITVLLGQELKNHSWNRKL